MTPLRVIEWMLFLASVHRWPGWAILLGCAGVAALQWLRRRISPWGWAA